MNNKLSVYPPILERPFIVIDEEKMESRCKFRVMQWNILAKALCQTEPDHTDLPTPSYVYDWDKFRLWRTLQEMTRYQSDIICIEEADVYEELKPYMHALGYVTNGLQLKFVLKKPFFIKHIVYITTRYIRPFSQTKLI